MSSSESDIVIEVHELSSQPTEYWKKWKETANVMRLQVKPPTKPPAENKVTNVWMWYEISDSEALIQLPEFVPGAKTLCPQNSAFRNCLLS